MSNAALTSAIEAMTDSSNKALFDVTIICTTDDYQAEFWTKRLSEGTCKPSEFSDSTLGPQFPMVLAVSEDWAPGGAGNGVGTLYAYEKACRVAKERHGVDIASLLGEKKVSAALYHTAGKGTRLAPLPASENNNKPGVKLPYCHELSDGTWAPLTVLESVVKQTGVYASSQKGRLSVYWGDQVFIPSAAFQYEPTHHIDIMCTLLGDTAPTAEEWVAQGLDKYGVIAVSKGKEKHAAQVEKVDHATAVQMLKSLGDIGQVGPSLGSFSVSSQMLDALCQEYNEELTAKAGKFDTDPHFWMPLTLPQDDYVALMSQKGVDKYISIAHHARMSKMKQNFDMGELVGLFGAVDVGKDASWWDYGQLKLYSKNNLKLLEDDEDAQLLRKFLGVTTRQMNSTFGDGVSVDDKSCAFSCSIKEGNVVNSVLSAVDCLSIEADGAIVVNCTAKKIVAPKGCILYNLVSDSEEGIIAEAGDVLVSVTEEDGSMMQLKSKMSIDGGKAWKNIVEGNSMSFEGVHGKNKDSNVTKIEQVRKEIFRKASESFSDK
eukprot:CAMPEP_0195519700 /NCGR_PEP_ID=MMETSP0794_2-20130614/15282_1 /TAXON_ID=515487 /ORGANISM="Stephanopyxis turris, Strain CCMP 815" /LENGTH=544 /DNA_ID=CAMNT_0040648893 /DNA_START=110 /DNA_END=1744 /DNA_ORIENTATION=+